MRALLYSGETVAIITGMSRIRAVELQSYNGGRLIYNEWVRLQLDYQESNEEATLSGY